jgi:hypothetical protein
VVKPKSSRFGALQYGNKAAPFRVHFANMLCFAEEGGGSLFSCECGKLKLR